MKFPPGKFISVPHLNLVLMLALSLQTFSLPFSIPHDFLGESHMLYWVIRTLFIWIIFELFLMLAVAVDIIPLFHIPVVSCFFFFCIHCQLWVSHILSQKVSILKFSAVICCWCIKFLLVGGSPPGEDLYQTFTVRTWWGFLTLTKLWRFPFVTHWSLSLLP